MQTYEDLKKNARKLVSLTSLTPEEFEYLLPAFEKAYGQVFPDSKTKTGQTRERKPGGGRKGALASIEQKLLFALVYQKSYPVQSIMGELFGIGQSQANEWIHTLLPILKQALDDLGYEPERDPKKFKKNEQGQKDADKSVIDGTERRRQGYLWQRATQQVEELWVQGERPPVIWDESVLEKPESLQAEGLCAVRSTKAVRLKRIKPGYYNPPGGRPIFVPGFHWLKVLVVGRKGAPTLAHMCWWTTRGQHASQLRTEEQIVLDHIDRLWGKEVVHIWDRGFAGNPWLTQVFLHGARGILRWPKNYCLLDEQEQLRKPGEISKGKRSWEHRLLWDARHRCECKTGVIAFPVFDPTHHQPLWLVVARRKGQSPWYLLTSEPAHTPALAWQIVLAYARRWQVEMTIRYNKCELAFESPRLFRWSSRHKLLLLAALAFAFLLSLLPLTPDSLAAWLLQTFCPRTGKRSQETPAPLYRLRIALSFLWLFHPPPFFSHL